jgi:hypothetical protein
MPKQAGQATVASRAPQCSQRGESDEAAAPHIGQLRVSTGTVKDILPNRRKLQEKIAFLTPILPTSPKRRIQVFFPVGRMKF